MSAFIKFFGTIGVSIITATAIAQSTGGRGGVTGASSGSATVSGGNTGTGSTSALTGGVGTNPNMGPGNAVTSTSQQYAPNKAATPSRNAGGLTNSTTVNGGVGVGASRTANGSFGTRVIGGSPATQPANNGFNNSVTDGIRQDGGTVVVPNPFAPQGTLGAPPPNMWRNASPYGDSGNPNNATFSARNHLTVPGGAANSTSVVGANGLPPSVQANLNAKNQNPTDPNRWRYVNQSGQWWYWTPGNYWQYYRGNNWYRFNPNSNRGPAAVPDSVAAAAQLAGGSNLTIAPGAATANAGTNVFAATAPAINPAPVPGPRGSTPMSVNSFLNPVPGSMTTTGRAASAGTVSGTGALTAAPFGVNASTSMSPAGATTGTTLNTTAAPMIVPSADVAPGVDTAPAADTAPAPVSVPILGS